MKAVIFDDEAYPVYHIRNKSAAWQNEIEIPDDLVERCRKLETEIQEVAEIMTEFIERTDYSKYLPVEK